MQFMLSSFWANIIRIQCEREAEFNSFIYLRGRFLPGLNPRQRILPFPTSQPLLRNAFISHLISHLRGSKPNIDTREESLKKSEKCRIEAERERRRPRSNIADYGTGGGKAGRGRWGQGEDRGGWVG